MKTVPSLCATATAVGVSAVGWSIGRPHSTTEFTLGTTPYEANDFDQTTPAPLDTRADDLPRPKYPFTSPLYDHRPYHGGRDTRRLKRKISTDLNSSEHSGSPRTFSPLDESHASGIDSRTVSESRPSWIKRLSTVSSQNSSRAYSSRPASPSVSCSNGSMAFSHDGSTAPIIGTPTPTPLPPNKLVKRSTSLRMLDSPPSAGSRLRPTLRRPATSHQRSATLHTVLQEHTADDTFLHDFVLPAKAQPEISYSKFFSGRAARQKTGVKTLGPIGETKTIKRVIPNGTDRSTLVLAKTIVSTSTTELDDISSQYSDSVTESRPVTPEQIPEQARPRASTLLSTKAHGPAKLQSDAKPRRSFSIGDYLASTPLSVKPRLSMSNGTKLQRKTGKRVASAPTVANALEATPERTVPQPANPEPVTTPLANPNALLSSEPSSASPIISRNTTVDSSGPSMTGTSSDSNTTGNSRSTREARTSTAASEQASTFIDSELDVREVWSGEDDDLDVQSDTLYDSIRTKATSGTNAPRRTPIEAVFNPPTSPSESSRPFMQRENTPKAGGRPLALDGIGNDSITEEDEEAASPGRLTVRTGREDVAANPDRATGRALFTSGVSSSPPDTPKPLSLGTLEWDAVPEEDDDRWSFSEEEEHDDKHSPSLAREAFLTSTPSNSLPRFSFGAARTNLSSKRFSAYSADRDTRSSIFDWAEQRQNDKSPGNQSPPRPSTVHGKKDTDNRSSRAFGRRAPSGLHARSQSVPVVPDVAGKRETVVTNKFGTWGVGSKGVSEDWNDDFDFEEPAGTDDKQNGEVRVDSGFSMLVPQTIREQQSNVLANIGLLREWGLLIEELKELRVRAGMLGLLDGGTWREVDAMIELADQEADEDPLEKQESVTSSPEFDIDAFDDDSIPAKSATNTPQKNKLGVKDENSATTNRLTPQSSRSRRKSILTPNKDIFQPTQTPPTHFQKTKLHAGSASAGATGTRPRKDSEAMAMTVIEALRQRRADPASSARTPSPSKKVPFDTATLKHIVPYVNSLMRRVKDELRDKEGLYSPSQSPQAQFSPFHNPFNLGSRHSPNPSPSSRKERRRSGDNLRHTSDVDMVNSLKIMSVG